MRRLRKMAFWTFGVLLAAAALGWVGLKGYLGSSHARRTAAAQLTEMIGLPVEVDRLDVGAGSTTAALRIPDPAADPPGDLIRIGSVNTDITLAGLLTGRAAPTTVTAADVEILLRLDADGQVLSPIPIPNPTAGKETGPKAALPTVRISGGRVRIRQVGHPEFDLSGVAGELHRDGDGYTLSGNVDDPKWGKWRVSGRLAADPADGRFELSTAEGRLKDPLLRSIPYVPTAVWDHLIAAGDTAATVTFTFKPGAPLGYAVELKPRAASLTLPDADVTLTGVGGRIRVADGKVVVEDGRVTLADGTATVSGTYQFDQATAVMAGKVTARGVDVRKLPPDWGLPKEIEGQLRGTADLELHVRPDGRVDPRGSGSGVVENAKFAGLPAEVRLKLQGDRGRYRFHTTD